MLRVKKIGGKHSDNKFCLGFTRYFNAQNILEAAGFIDLEYRLKQHSDKKVVNKMMRNFWLEYQIFNESLLIEQLTCHLLSVLYKKNKMDTEKIMDGILDNVCRYNNWKIKKAKKYLNNKFNERKKISDKIQKKEDVIFNPYFLFDVSGMTLGSVADAILKHTDKNLWTAYDLPKEIQKFYKYRNHLIHHLLSSRYSYTNLLKNAPIVGKRIIDTIKRLIEHEDDEEKRKTDYVENLLHKQDCAWCKNA